MERWKGREYEDEEKTSTEIAERKEKILEFARGRTQSQSLDKSLWKRIWACYKTVSSQN